VQDRDGAFVVLRSARRLFPFIALIYGDGGYQGRKMQAALAATGSWKLEIVKRANLHHFEVLPKRWIVERTLAWISRNRRLARLRALRPHRRSLRAPRDDPHHAPALDQAKSFNLNPNFMDRL
jgi:Transposase DDE domain